MVEEKVKTETWLKKIQSQECRLREITDSMKRSNVRITSIPEWVEKNRGLQEIFEQIVAENIPNLARETNIHIQEAERTPPKLKTTNLRHVTSQCNSQISDPRLSFRIDGEITTFQNSQSLTNFITMKPALQEILRGVL